MTLPVMYGFQLETREGRAPRAWPRFMTARVAADYADSSPWTIRRHVHPCGRRGRSFVYAIEAVEEWMRGIRAGERAETEPATKSRRQSVRAAGRDLATTDQREPIVAARDEHVAA